MPHRIELEFSSIAAMRDFLLAAAPILPRASTPANPVLSEAVGAPVSAVEAAHAPAAEAPAAEKKERKPRAKKEGDAAPPADMAAPEEPRSAEETATGKALTADDGRAAGKRLMDRIGSAEGMKRFSAEIQKFNALRVSDIPAAKMAEFIAHIDSIMPGE